MIRVMGNCEVVAKHLKLEIAPMDLWFVDLPKIDENLMQICSTIFATLLVMCLSLNNKNWCLFKLDYKK